jgi:hypothetical protein
MNPQDQLIKLLHEHSFDLVRQRKHKIYRNPDGLIFVTASTPSDRRAPQNALSTLKRMLRHLDAAPAPVDIMQPVSLPDLQRSAQDLSMMEPAPAAKPEPEPAPLSEGEWEAWKRHYWHDEKLRAKNERFLSVVSTYVGRISDLRQQGKRINSGPASEALRSILRDLGYKSNIVLYALKAFEKGIIVYEKTDEPIVWASNNHIGVSAFVILNAYAQHSTARPDTLHFNWDGIPLLFDRPEKGSRKSYASGVID